MSKAKSRSAKSVGTIRSRLALQSLQQPNVSASSATAPHFISSGAVCGFCLMPLEATLHGESIRHVESKLAYGECDQAKRTHEGATGPDICEGVLEEAQAFNERHRAVLDAYDTLDPKNWEYYPAHDGNKARRIFIPMKGLK